MERLSSLINRLQEMHEKGSSKQELLLIVEQLKNELTDSVNIIEHYSQTNSVSVMMPAGYHILTTALEDKKTLVANPLITANIEPVVKMNADMAVPSDLEMEEKEESITEIQEAFEEVMPKYSVPRPPVVATVEEDEGEVIQEENISQKETVMQPGEPEVFLPMQEETKPEPEPETSLIDDIFGFLKFSKPEKKDSTVVRQEEKTETAEKPLVFELELNEVVPQEPFRTVIKPQLEREEIDDILTLEMPESKPRPKELHEILAARVVATPQGQPESKKILSEKLGSGKITDLKKGIAINDRFRFIKSLFRGDETLFDRSIKTINNFNILPEAQYWIQRELVIKLGWNDDDELVQQFYSLVSRRFL